MVVTIEQRLNTIPAQQHLVLPHLILTIVLPFAICILGIEVIFFRRDERRLVLMSEQSVPVVVLKPDMFLDFLRTVEAQTVDGFALDQFVYKVGCLESPAWRDFVLTDLNLLGEDMVTDFLSVFAQVGSLAEHAFVANDSHCEVVNCHSMILATHYFGCCIFIDCKQAMRKLPM
jgi:hypothetical protein